MKFFADALDYCEYYMGNVVYAFEQVFRKRFACHVLSGPEKNSGATIRIRYSGEEKSLDYIKTLFFQTPPEDSIQSHYSLLQLVSGRHPKIDGCDIRIREFTPRVMKYIRTKGSFRIPDWIEQEITLDGSWEDVVARFRKNTRTTDLRKVRKYNFAHDIVYDEPSIDYFYDNLYLPYITRRFGAAVETVDREWLSHVAEYGGLLRIIDGDRILAGVVLHHDDDYLDWIWTGALTTENVELENGAFSSLYFHSIKYAHDKGFPLIRLNNSRAFLSDGLFRYKRKWGARIAKSRSSDTDLLLDIDYSSKAVRDWLESSPFLGEQDGRFYANIFCFGDHTDCDNVMRQIEGLVSPGISGVNIYTTQPIDSLPEYIDSSEIRAITVSVNKGR